ncbi:60S ribosomal protein L31 [Candidatus Woesearchaeota archaeon]|nr:60S ribosomal protein L31 [Candidatus Woesearchaeota archaeon]
MEERIYVIPLRKSFRHVPSYAKTKRAVREVGYFISKHMKSDNVKIATELSNLIHKHGRKNPPAKIKVKAVKDVKKDKHKKDVEFVMVHSFDYKEPVKVVKKAETKVVAKPEVKTEKKIDKLLKKTQEFAKEKNIKEEDVKEAIKRAKV